MELQVGSKVRVPKSLNFVWVGEGTVTAIHKGHGNYNPLGTAIVKMETGSRKGETGGFDLSQLESVNPPSMEILKIKRSGQGTGLKIYGKVLSTSGETYNFAYIRRPNFRGWLCGCESFFFDKFKKGRNCKHLRFVRGQVGRFGASVPKS